MDPFIKSTSMIVVGILGIAFIGFYDLIMERGYVSFGIFSLLAVLACIGLIVTGAILKKRSR